MLRIRVSEDGVFLPHGQRMRCALGRGGLVLDKKEGDGGTPVGCWQIRRVLYRSDRVSPPTTDFPCRAIEPEDGWCDDPADAAYNKPISLPFAASHEKMWRDDNLYDIVVVLGHNDDPPIPGKGSAIFMHVARPDYGPTEGCVALAMPDLLSLLRAAPDPCALEIGATTY